MRSILFFAVGSRGDIQPVVALAAHLLDTHAIDEAHLQITSDYAGLVGSNPRMRVHKHAHNSMAAFYATSSALRSAPDAGADAVATSRRAVGRIVRDRVTPLTPVLHDLVTQLRPVAVVATTLGALCVKSVAQRLRVPAYVIHFQPNVPTSCFPFYLTGFEEAAQAARIIAAAGAHGGAYAETNDCVASYEKFYEWFEDSVDDTNALNAGHEIAPMDKPALVKLFSGTDPDVRILLSYPTALVPTPPTQSASVVTVESLAEAYVPSGWDPETSCASLYKYIASASTQPVCISVGSMSVPPDEVKRISAAVFGGLRFAGVQTAVLVRGSGSAHISRALLEDAGLAEWAAAHVHECEESVEFAWLFGLCAGVVTHGGAGTVAAALCAGVPVAVAPMQCDQYLWAELVERRGVGAYVRPGLLECTGDGVCDAVTRMRDGGTVRKAREYRERRSSSVGGCEAVRRVLKGL